MITKSRIRKIEKRYRDANRDKNNLEKLRELWSWADRIREEGIDPPTDKWFKDNHVESLKPIFYNIYLYTVTGNDLDDEMIKWNKNVEEALNKINNGKDHK